MNFDLETATEDTQQTVGFDLNTAQLLTQEEEQLLIEEEAKRKAALSEQEQQITNKKVLYGGGYADTLPETLDFGLFEMETPAWMEAMTSGYKHGVTDTYRGGKQIIGWDEDQMALEEAEMNLLYNSDVGTYGRVGQVLGYLTDPVGFIAPWLAVNKARKLYKFMDTVDKGTKVAKTAKAARTSEILAKGAEGAIAGGVSGATTYIDPESDLTRWETTGIGAVFGGVVGTVVGKVVDAKKASKANSAIDSFEKDIASIMTTENKRWHEAVQDVFELYPELQDQLWKSTKYVDRTPLIFRSQDEAQRYVDKNINFKQNWSTGKPWLDQAFGMMSTRLSNYSQLLGQRFKNIDYHAQLWAHDWKKEVKPFEEVLHKIQKADPRAYENISFGLSSGDFAAVEQELLQSGIKDADIAFNKAKDVMETIWNKGVDVGLFKDSTNKIGNYWHREIADYDGLMDHLTRKYGKTVQSVYGQSIDDLVMDFSKDFAKIHGFAPNELQKNQYAIALLQSKSNAKPKINLGYGQGRNIVLEKDMLPYYKDPLAAIDGYIHNIAADAAKAEFLGKGNIRFSDYGEMLIPDSAKDMVASMKDLSGLNRHQMTEIGNIITARMVADKMQTHKVIQNMRGFAHGYLLGNPFSAMTQLGDLYAPVYKNQIGDIIHNAVTEEVRAAGGKAKFTVEDFGFIDTAIKEMENVGSMKKLYDRWLRAGGFTNMDKFGKKAFLLNAYKQLETAALDGTSREAKYFANKYRRLLGKDYNSVIREIRNMQDGGTLSEKAKSILYMELSDFQPVGLAETTEIYAKHPNMRAAYFLQSFLLKILDVNRREAFRKVRLGTLNGKKGMWEEGLKDLAKLSILVAGANGGSNMLKDWTRGRDIQMEPEEIPLSFVRNLFRTYGLDPYTLENELGVKKSLGGTVTDIVFNGPSALAAPVDDLLKAAKTEKDAWGREYTTIDPDRIVKTLPVFGKALSETEWLRGPAEEIGLMPPPLEETPTEKYNRKRAEERAKIRAERYTPDVSKD